jgi:hypothetical protein
MSVVQFGVLQKKVRHRVRLVAANVEETAIDEVQAAHVVGWTSGPSH